MKIDNRLLQLIAIILLMIVLLFGIAFVFPAKAHASYPTVPNNDPVSFFQNLTLQQVHDVYHTLAPTSTCTEIPFQIWLRPDRITAFSYGYYNGVLFFFPINSTTCARTVNNYMTLYSYSGVNYLRTNYYPNANWTVAEGWTTGGSYQRNSLHPNYSVSSVYKGTENLYFSNSTDVNYGTSYGSLGLLNASTLLVPANYELDGSLVGAEPEIKENYQYYFEYYDSDFANGYIRLEFSDEVTVDAFTTTGETLFNFSGDYNYLGMSPSGLDVATPSETPPSFEIDDLEDPCLNIKASNYVLKDDTGTYICEVTVNPIIDNLAPPYTGLINFDSSQYDWGTFNFLLDAFQFLFDAIDDLAGWFYGLWQGLLSLLIPSPNAFGWFAQDIRNAVNDKFSLDSYLDIIDEIETATSSTDDSVMPNITGSLMGVEGNFVDFSLIDDNISVIRPVLQVIVVFSVLIFDINIITKFFGEEPFTS